MEPDKILEYWKSYENRLDEVLVLHRGNSLDITRMKMRSMLRSMSPVKVFAITVGIVWVIVVDAFLLAVDQASIFFLVSMTIQSLITKIAIGIYVYQLVLVYKLDVESPVAQTQHRLGKLANSTLLATRILFLQLPLWTTFFLNSQMIENAGSLFIILQSAITLSFTIAAWWLFKNIRWENRNKRWFKLFFSGIEWIPILRSIELSREIELLNNGIEATN